MTEPSQPIAARKTLAVVRVVHLFWSVLAALDPPARARADAWLGKQESKGR